MRNVLRFKWQKGCVHCCLVFLPQRDWRKSSHTDKVTEVVTAKRLLQPAAETPYTY